MILSANQAVKVDDTELIKFYVDFEDMIRNTTNIIANQKGEVKSRTPNKLQININDFLIENR
jgi:hypothetical protein